jgi:hypothetical protein
MARPAATSLALSGQRIPGEAVVRGFSLNKPV